MEAGIEELFVVVGLKKHMWTEHLCEGQGIIIGELADAIGRCKQGTRWFEGCSLCQGRMWDRGNGIWGATWVP